MLPGPFWANPGLAGDCDIALQHSSCLAGSMTAHAVHPGWEPVTRHPFRTLPSVPTSDNFQLPCQLCGISCSKQGGVRPTGPMLSPQSQGCSLSSRSELARSGLAGRCKLLASERRYLDQLCLTEQLGEPAVLDRKRV